MLGPMIEKGAGLDEPNLKQVPGFEKLLGFTSSMEPTAGEEEVVVSA